LDVPGFMLCCLGLVFYYPNWLVVVYFQVGLIFCNEFLEEKKKPTDFLSALLKNSLRKLK
jgi:hypothetical protein